MSKINIEKSNLENSPIITDSLNTTSKKNKKNFLNKPLIKYLVLPLLVVIVGGLIVYYLTVGSNMDKENNSVNINDSNLENSPIITDSPGTIVGDVIINNAPEKELYLSPNKKLIKPDMADYVFPFKIVNEKNQDFNDVALVILVPEDFGMYRIQVDPLDKNEKIVKYNGSMEIMLPGIGFQKDGYYWCIYNIESIYARETKEYSITVNTRDYSHEFNMIFKWTSLSENPKLKEFFKGFGVE